MEISLHIYGGQEVPPYAICKLENQGASGTIQCEPKDLITGVMGDTDVRPWIRGLKTRNSNVQGQEKMNVSIQEERKTAHPYSIVLFYLGPQ